MALVKLNSFNISNYRSIINTGWRSLAGDNITVLIGQNESGKTSVLEALHSFYTNSISEDVLRSDNTFPEVSCNFLIVNNQHTSDLIEGASVSPALLEILKNEKDFILTRSWLDNKASHLFISSEKVSEFFTDIELKEKVLVGQTEKEIEKLGLESEQLFKILEHTEREKTLAYNDLLKTKKFIDDKERQLKKAKKHEDKAIVEVELNSIKENYNRLEENYNEKSGLLENLKQKTKEISEKLGYCKAYSQSKEELGKIEVSLQELKRSILELEHIYELSTSEKDKKNIYSNIQHSHNELEQSKSLIAQLKSDVKLKLLVLSKILLEGIDPKQAEANAMREISETNQYLDKYAIGELLYNKIPVFEYFEDFSGLLPNKIDLEDILNHNQQVEGYKAALNFLKIAGLETSFFREKNHRILKQRIETLNSDVTVNFQDYWSQQVGKDNKIRLHFELEHYDYTVPEKSGKPYLEFWIKDNQERLYPKQRSRGVRWFLSFYLELKAAAVKSENNRVLLIDEPGLSLHARAQEDVLKVFEDLKQSMQIVYCTHSPHLIKTEKLYRILAVQRANEDDDKSESVIYEPSMLSEASADTLTPIYSMMGIRLTDQQIIQNNHNIIVPDTITYYYLFWLNKIIPKPLKINFIPASGAGSILQLMNILSCWQINFGVVLFGRNHDQLLHEIDEQSLLETKITNKIRTFDQFDFPEDIFSAIDFKKYILLHRTGITEKNSEFISINGLSRKILATNFVNLINENKLNYSGFDETSKQNITELFASINEIL